MMRFQFLLVGLVLLAPSGFAYVTRNSGEVLTSYTFVAINAPVDKVWRLLTDTSAFPQWNPYIVEVNGTLKVGVFLFFVVASNGQRHTHRVRVTRMDLAGHELQWVGGLVPSALLTWDEGFTVEHIDDGHSRVAIVNSHQGLLAKLYRKYYQNSDLQAYREFSSALKKKAEQ